MAWGGAWGHDGDGHGRVIGAGGDPEFRGQDGGDGEFGVELSAAGVGESVLCGEGGGGGGGEVGEEDVGEGECGGFGGEGVRGGEGIVCRAEGGPVGRGWGGVLTERLRR